jgi:manganese transport protein
VVPLPIVLLLWFSGRTSLMAEYANRPVIKLLGIAAAVIVISLNAVLLWQTLGLPVPGLRGA